MAGKRKKNSKKKSKGKKGQKIRLPLVYNIKYKAWHSIKMDAPENKCPICWQSITHRCFTNECYHSFCLNCLLTWCRASKENKNIVDPDAMNSPYKPTCPCCRSNFAKIICEVKDPFNYAYFNMLTKKPRKKTIQRPPSCVDWII